MLRRLSLALALCALPAVLAGACGDDDDAAGAPQATTGGAQATVAGATAAQPASTAAPTLDGPASKYSVLLADIGLNAYITDLKKTFVLTPKNYGASAGFDSAEKGEALLTSWGYLGGYETAMNPEGLQTAVLNGAYYVYMETHLFATTDGAHKAYDYFQKRIAAMGVAQPVSAEPIGNESGAWRAVQGKIGSSNVSQAFHQIVFRRGNLVAIVQTVGAEPFMKVDRVTAIAMIADGKALGQREAIAPTPIVTPPAVAATPTTPAR